MNAFANADRLSSREWQVIALAAKGYANKIIARELSLTEGTVKLHLHNIYQKLGIRSRFALVLLVNNLPHSTNDPRGSVGAI